MASIGSPLREIWEPVATESRASRVVPVGKSWANPSKENISIEKVTMQNSMQVVATFIGNSEEASISCTISEAPLLDDPPFPKQFHDQHRLVALLTLPVELGLRSALIETRPTVYGQQPKFQQIRAKSK